jgi:hypothetical protein
MIGIPLIFVAARDLSVAIRDMLLATRNAGCTSRRASRGGVFAATTFSYSNARNAHWPALKVSPLHI